ncbi:MAG: ferrochelatase [Proteobacteria bacterium]|nr:ferrochelatase [Pseudomonadota bacterium]HQR02923.1 ferrochelatase [Rhodocyclaceae bacterium]
MSRFHPEPAHPLDSPADTAILLVNLGTPEAPTAVAVRPYLRQFLSDPRVVEIPRTLWWPLLYGVILNTRPARSAQKYARVWMPEGSPLKVHTERQAKLLQGLLGQRGDQVKVAWAMRYGQPSIAAVLDRLKVGGARRILILPLYPQYAASTTASAFDAVAQWGRSCRNLPELRLVRSFHDHGGYINALAASVREHWARTGSARKLVMSFHGTPQRSLDLGDPYYGECQKTGRLLAETLGLGEDRYQITFQSRFGRARWLQPYTQATLEQLARADVKRVDVICPGFVGDCLETLEEIEIEGKTAFLAAGGSEFHFISGLNERPDWIRALADIAADHLAGWPEGSATANKQLNRELRTEP